MRKAESTSPLAQKAQPQWRRCRHYFFRDNDDDIRRASQEGDGINAQEKAAVELQQENAAASNTSAFCY
jgi:hypothetical protein